MSLNPWPANSCDSGSGVFNNLFCLLHGHRCKYPHRYTHVHMHKQTKHIFERKKRHIVSKPKFVMFLSLPFVMFVILLKLLFVRIQSTAPEKLSNQENPKRNAWIVLKGEVDEISWVDWGQGTGQKGGDGACEHKAMEWLSWGSDREGEQ